MRKCPNCSADIDEKDTTCPVCGADLTKNEINDLVLTEKEVKNINKKYDVEVENDFELKKLAYLGLIGGIIGGILGLIYSSVCLLLDKNKKYQQECWVGILFGIIWLAFYVFLLVILFFYK